MITAVTVAGPAFADAARWVGAWVPAKPDVLVQGGVRVVAGDGTVTLEVFDGMTAVSASVHGTGTSGVAVVSGRLLAALAPTLGKADVTLDTAENGALRLRQGRTELTLPVMPPMQWSSANLNGAPLAEISGSVLASVVKRVALATAESDDQGMIFSCMRLGFDAERISVMAATRQHFAAAARPWTFNDEMLGVADDVVPTYATPRADRIVQAAEAFAGADAVEISASWSLLRLETTSRSIAMRLHDCEGKWPATAVQQLAVRPYEHAVTVSRAELAGPLKQAVIVREKDGTAKVDLEPIRLTFADGEIRVSGHGSKSAAGAVTAVDADGYTGPGVAYAFNPAYLADALKGAPGDAVKLEFQSVADVAGVRFTCDDDPTWYHTVAPIRR